MLPIEVLYCHTTSLFNSAKLDVTCFIERLEAQFPIALSAIQVTFWIFQGAGRAVVDYIIVYSAFGSFN